MNGVLLRLAWRGLERNRATSLLLLVIMTLSTTLMTFFTFSYMVVNRQAITASELVAPQVRAKITYQPDLAQQLPNTSSYLDRHGEVISSLNAADRAISPQFQIGRLLPEGVQAIPELVFSAQMLTDRGQSGTIPVSLSAWQLLDPQEKTILKGHYPEDEEIALSSEQAELLGVSLGEQLSIDYGFGKKTLKVVGIVRNWHTYIRNAAIVGPGLLEALCEHKSNKAAIICENSQYYPVEKAETTGKKYDTQLWYNASALIKPLEYKQQLLGVTEIEPASANHFLSPPAALGSLESLKEPSGNLDRTGKYVSTTSTAPNETWLPEDIGPGQLYVASYQVVSSQSLPESVIKALSLKHLRTIDLDADQGLKTSLLRTHLSNFIAPVLYYTASLFLLTLPLLTVATRRQIREIKTLYALGISPRQLRKILMLQTTITGLVASLLGLFAGFILVQTFISTYIASRTTLWLVALLIFLLGFTCAQAASIYPLRNLLKSTEITNPRNRLNTAWVLPIAMLLVLFTTMPLASLIAEGKPSAILIQKLAAIILLCLMAPVFLSMIGYLRGFIPNWVLGRIVLSNLKANLYRLAPGVGLLILVAIILGTQVLNITRVGILEGFDKQTIHFEYVSHEGENSKAKLDQLSAELETKVGNLEHYDYQGVSAQIYAPKQGENPTKPSGDKNSSSQTSPNSSIDEFLLPYQIDVSDSASNMRKTYSKTEVKYHLPQRYQLEILNISKAKTLTDSLESLQEEKIAPKIYSSSAPNLSAKQSQKLADLAEDSNKSDNYPLASDDLVVDDGTFLSYLGFNDTQVKAAKTILSRQGIVTVANTNKLSQIDFTLVVLPAVNVSQSEWQTLQEQGKRSEIVKPKVETVAELEMLSLKSPKSQRSWVIISPQLAEKMQLDTQLRGRIITPQDYIFPYQIWGYIENVLQQNGALGIYANFYFYSKYQVSWLGFSAVLAMLMILAIIGVVVNIGIGETLNDMRVLNALGASPETYKQSSMLVGMFMGICGFIPGFMYAIVLQFIPLGLAQVNNQWGISTWVLIVLLTLASIGVCAGSGYLFAPKISGNFSRQLAVFRTEERY